MKKIYTAFSLLLLVGCTDSFEEFNKEKKHPMDVPGESLFSNASKDLADIISSTNVNDNVFKFYAQYWNETTYTDETNYDLIKRNNANNMFRYYYRGVLKDLKEAASCISATEYALEDPEIKDNKLHIIQLLQAYAFQQLVDIFGAVPYKEALDINNVYPKYDTGEVIYNDLIEKVKAAVADLDEDFESFGSADLIYGGDVSHWKKFGNSLLVKLGITLADYNAELAEATILVGAAGAFDSAGDDALFPYQTSSPNFNPLYVDIIASGRNDFVPANTIVDIMNSLEDPRRAAYFTFAPDGTYKGGAYGFKSAYTNHSHIPSTISAPDFKGILLTYSEIQFYLAEAAARGFALPSPAEEYYNEAIRAAFAFWGVDGVDAYLDKPEVKYDATQWEPLIATQAWIAFYTRGLEGWTSWRRFDLPRFKVAQFFFSESDISTRFTFPINEQTLNATNYQAISKAIGGDLRTTRIFWDTYPVTDRR
ncbi:MAG: SusD/RagB family nutrient-binding outer membrane lipoprotein [Tannerellaceae bacterium]|nr:SusD/RagB family nutrient-binding outer membrane lipoprotein [Tannerellaceae bacterium]